MRTMQEKNGSQIDIRYLAASATIPNAIDIAQWLKDRRSNPASCLTFGERDRSVPLQKHVYSAPLQSRNPYTFDLSLNNRLPNLIKEHSNNQPTLIFCNTRKSCEITAKFLADHFRLNRNGSGSTGNFKLDGS